MELLVEPTAILGVRQHHTESTSVIEVLVQWKDLPDFEATWESFATIQNQFPEFHLVDKVVVWEEGNDKPPVRFTYARRAKNNQWATFIFFSVIWLLFVSCAELDSVRLH